MKLIPTAIADVVLMEPQVFSDERGFFMETFRADELAALSGGRAFVQDNQSGSVQGVLRGLHYQVGEHAQGKLVRVVQGEIFDVVVDMRPHSPTFGQWTGHRLSAENRQQLWIPEGFAHGFYVLSEYAECVYKCTGYYHPAAERSVRWDDPQLAIQWPLAAGREPCLSDKDRHAPLFQDAEKFSPII